MKPKRILKISFTDEARLQTLASFTLTPARAVAVLTGLLLVTLLVGYLLVLLTPLKTLIPGYFRESQRATTEEALLRVDSIREAYLRNEAYIANLTSIFDASRPAEANLNDTLSPLVGAEEKLLPASPQETSFVRMMQEKEKFNISVVAPMAAEGMLFYPVSDEGVVASDSREALQSRIILPDGASIMAVADGVVIASFYDHKSAGYSLLIQHDNGFVSRYSALGTPLVGEAESVNGGQVLALPPSPRKGRPAEVWVRLWHDATPLKPFDYISSPHSYTSLQP